MEFYAKVLTQKESNTIAEKIQKDYAEHGYGFWAVEAPDVASFIGYIGLNYWNLEMDFAPCIDIGWRIASLYWGFGYATEGAKEVLRYGFKELNLEEIVGMATIKNHRSQRLMERLNMKHDPKENFHHPMLKKSDPLSLRTLYRLSKRSWLNSCQSK